MDDFTAELLAAHPPDPPSVTATTINAASSNMVTSSSVSSSASASASHAATPSSRLTSSSGSITAAPNTPTPSRTARIRDRVAAFREKANVQDKLLEKLLQRFIPAEYGGEDPYSSASGGGARARNLADNPSSSDPNVSVPGEDRPNFHIATMSANFRRFNARIGSVFHFQAQAFEVLAWKQPSHTLSLLAVYTFVCLDPSLLAALPLALGVFGIFVPSFIARHPATSATGADAEMSPGLVRYSVNGPPIAPAITVSPVKELSKDFFRNMRDLQNCMEDFTRGHDAVVTTVIPLTNFSDEALSSALCVLAIVACFLMLIGSHLLPWKLLFLVGGWAAIVSGHPAVARWLAHMQEENISPDAKEEARSWLDAWIARDMILDSAPETREVEVFELQRSTSAGLFGGGGSGGDGLGSGEWEPWLFAPSPYDPLSHARLAGERPRGTRFFEDVLPPDGWEWSEKKWALDLWSREWVEERIITGVEVETEGERWVYDMHEERDGRHYNDDDDEGGGGGSGSMRGKRSAPGPSWEEGSDDAGRRGDWRRRRWVRLVKRKNIAAGTSG